jgi:hypothetical protein
MFVVMDGCIGQDSEATGLIPRAPRIRLRIPVIFDFAGGRARGQSTDISASGVLAVLDQRLGIWLIGRLSILVEERPIAIEAHVARVNGYARRCKTRPQCAA